MRHVSILLVLALLAGCGKRPASVNEANQLKNKAVLAYAEQNKQIHLATQGAIRAESVAHIETKYAWDLEKIAEHADGDGKIDVREVTAFIEKINGQRNARIAVIDDQQAKLREAVEISQENLAAYLKLEDLINQYDDAGVDLQAITGQVKGVLEDILKQKAAKK